MRDRLQNVSIFGFCLNASRGRSPCLGVLAMVCVGAAVALGGCAAGGAPLPSADGATGAVTVAGDWDDVDAAVEVGAAQAECAVVSSSAGAGGAQRTFEVKHISGQRLTLTVTRADTSANASRISVVAAAQLVRDAELERRLAQRVGLRLSDLAGKEFAPIRE